MMGAYQKGISAVNALAAIAVMMAIFLAVKLVPPYIENMYIKDALKFLVKTHSANLSQMENSEIMSALSKYTMVNTVGPDQAKSFKVHRLQDRILVNSIYEVRVPMALNIDAVLSFENQLDTTNPDKCCKYLVDHEKQKD